MTIVVTREQAEKILNDSLSTWSREHGAAWEMLLLLQGKAGPSGYYIAAARRAGIELEPWRMPT